MAAPRRRSRTFSRLAPTMTSASPSSTSTVPVSAAATACTGVMVRISRFLALRATCGSTTVQAPRSLRTGLAAVASWRISASLSGLAVQRDLPLEGEHRVRAEQPGHQRPLLRPLVAVLERGARRQVAAEAARPQHVDADPPQRGHPVVEERDQLVGVERDLVGHPQLEQPVEHRPGVRGRPQGDGGVGAGPVAEAVVLRACRSTAAPRRTGAAGRARRAPGAPAGPSPRPAPPRRPRRAARW